MIENQILEKWSKLIDAAVKYYKDCVPTGWTDAEYDEMEKRAIEEDGFSVRDYVFETYFPKGERYKNSYITKFKKEKVKGTMFEAISKYGDSYYYPLKLDGISMAIYIDPTTGQPMRAVTCGNSSLGFGIDQTWKIIGLDLLPHRFPKGIVAIQCECLIDLDRIGENIDPERARQKCGGIINGKKDDVIEDAKNLLTLRAYRYYCSDSPDGIALSQMDYKEVIDSLPTKYAEDGHITFAPTDIYTWSWLQENPSFCETDHTRTSTGFFLNDGYVVYDKSGNVVLGLKFAGAGSTTETMIKTTVRSIQWNDQASKGKDSWSANVLIDPIVLHGSTVKKPSAGSVAKLLKKNITPGASVSVILANSTIPMVGECYSPGNGDFQWPTCSCGYGLGPNDIFGSGLKCGNPECTSREARMRKYVGSLDTLYSLDLNKLFVVDRFKWESTEVSIPVLVDIVLNGTAEQFYVYLSSFLGTEIQIKNFNLVWRPAWKVLKEYVCKK